MTDSVQPRTCVLCEHWTFTPGHPDYSEWTLGTSWSSGCGKSHWYLDGYRESKRTYAEKLLTAKACPDFKVAWYVEEASSQVANFAITMGLAARGSVHTAPHEDPGAAMFGPDKDTP